MSLPYCFGGFRNFQLRSNILERILLQRHFGKEIYSNINAAYLGLIEGLAEQDTEFLSQVLEPSLFKKVEKGLADLDKSNYSLRVEDSEDFPEDLKIPEAEKDKSRVMLVDPRASFGASINRLENKEAKGTFFELSSPTGKREYYVNSNNISRLWEKRVLSLTVHLIASKHLYCFDENDQKMVRNQEGKLIPLEDLEISREEFEMSEALLQVNPLDRVGNMGEDEEEDRKALEVHSIRLEGYSPSFDWVITDIDNQLNGNRYFPNSKRLWGK